MQFFSTQTFAGTFSPTVGLNFTRSISVYVNIKNVNLCDMAALGVSSCDLQQIPQDKPELLGRPGKRRENTLHGDWVLDAAMPKRADYATIRAYTKALPAFTKHIASVYYAYTPILLLFYSYNTRYCTPEIALPRNQRFAEVSQEAWRVKFKTLSF